MLANFLSSSNSIIACGYSHAKLFRMTEKTVKIKLIVKNGVGQLLVVKHSNGVQKDDVWALPGVSLKACDSLEMGLRQALLEEAGVSLDGLPCYHSGFVAGIGSGQRVVVIFTVDV